ncbi:MAG: iron-containing alcohol dehydrogenase [Treponema sp.]|jgi:glycerol-1-phosphate dehydrogenase [NAD(P)+]|nr:iron-containing alcohol dehydrogenase [Treponema sp.]
MDTKAFTLAECLEAAADTKEMIVKDGAVAEIPALLKRRFTPAGGGEGGGGEGAEPAVFIVADANTWEAAGAAVLETVRAAGMGPGEAFVFPAAAGDAAGWIHPDYGRVTTLTGAIRAFQERRGKGAGVVPVAAGSGTINDLVKRASSELGLPYLCVPTAASVDGYTSHGAALLYQGCKQTLPCEAPRAVAADSAILAAAPAFLSSSGFGDLAGKYIAGSDWIISDALAALDPELAPGLAAIEPRAWAMVQGPLEDNLARSVQAARGDREAVGTLFEALGITGFSMQYLRNSRAVSGCEHMWSHVWEMENLSHRGVPVTHGHKVALGTLAALAFTERCFAEKPGPPRRRERRPSRAEREAAVREAFAGLGAGGAVPAVEGILKTAGEKFSDDPAGVRRLQEGILDRWEEIRRAVFERLPPYGELRALLAEARCPVTPAEIGLTRGEVIAAARKAQMIRCRFTVLDLAFEAGIFEDVLRRVEEDKRYL